MKFLADESVEKAVVDWLRDQKFDVAHIIEKVPSISDEEVIKLANSENRILITNDKDFGELIFHQGKIAPGILLIRATNEQSSNKVELVGKVLKMVKNKLEGHFVVVSEVGIRIKKFSQREIK
ncbi:MAG: DUF5615 family PIN-like protein [Candidatus Aerophobetes bacterium]|nr:DUF5615 family PIN-like protein [Candidatus Aerophobetes bacterium]